MVPEGRTLRPMAYSGSVDERGVVHVQVLVHPDEEHHDEAAEQKTNDEHEQRRQAPRGPFRPAPEAAFHHGNERLLFHGTLAMRKAADYAAASHLLDHVLA